MCGIVALLSLNHTDVSRETVERMRDTMSYRGPDDSGVYVSGKVGLGHRRLAILDLSPAGHQPMTNEDGTLWIVFNGEIYNFVELAAGLKARGHQFHSNSDTEVILHLYEEEGERCVERLNGMFAFVIWDARTQTLFAARDRLGIKPLNYYAGPDAFICASEIKAILEHERVPRVAKPEYVADYLFAGYSLDGKTPVRDIQQLLPGHSLTVRDGRVRTREYWTLKSGHNTTRSYHQVVGDVRELLDDAIRIHCRSDAPLGSHLSGGLDSSSVSAFAARHVVPLQTFSIRFNGDAYFDETRYARALARHAGTKYVESTPGPQDLAALLPSLLWHLEVPMPTDGAFAYYTASRLAVDHVKVCLTGHGGDEVFAGYPAQFAAAFGSQSMFPASGVPSLPPLSRVQRLRRALRTRGLRGLMRTTGQRLRGATPTLEDTWVRLHCGPEPRDSALLKRSFVTALGAYSPRTAYLAPLLAAPAEHAFDKVLYHDLRCYLPGLLHMEDRFSMAVSLESRVPLLDYRIVEYLATVPPEQKVRGLEPKFLLRAAAAPLLPESVRERRTKLGFPIPMYHWVTNELAPLVRTVLHSPQCLDRGILAPDQIRAGDLTPEETIAALNIELWHQLFIDRDPRWRDVLATASEPSRSSRAIGLSSARDGAAARRLVSA